MKRVPLHEAEGRLAELLDAAAEGEDVQITRGDGATFRLTPLLGVASEAGGYEEGALPRPGSLREDIARMQERIGRLPRLEQGADEALVGYDRQGLPR